jgi:hypothetical protein
MSLTMPATAPLSREDLAVLFNVAVRLPNQTARLRFLTHLPPRRVPPPTLQRTNLLNTSGLYIGTAGLSETFVANCT